MGFGWLFVCTLSQFMNKAIIRSHIVLFSGLLLCKSALGVSCVELVLTPEPVVLEPGVAYGTVYSTNHDYLTKEVLIERDSFPQANLRVLKDNREWLVEDRELAPQLELKKRLLRYRRSDIVKLDDDPKTLEAAKELLEMLADHLPATYPEIYQRVGSVITNKANGEVWDIANPSIHPMEIAGRLVQEDLVLIKPTENGQYVMAGGMLAFPSGWSLRTFMGRNIDEVHANVTGYGDKLARIVNGILSKLPPDRIQMRNNWFIYVDPTLAQPDYRVSTFPALYPNQFRRSNLGKNTWLRSERETLRKLPKSGYILFTIKEHVYPMEEVMKVQGFAERLLAGLAKDPEADERGFLGALEKYLQEKMEAAKSPIIDEGQGSKCPIMRALNAIGIDVGVPGDAPSPPTSGP